MVLNGIKKKSVGVAAEAKFHAGSSFSYTDAWAWDSDAPVHVL